MRPTPSRRRFTMLYLVPCALLILFLLFNFRNLRTDASQNPETSTSKPNTPLVKDAQRLLTGQAIAPKLENATAKAELGRAAWKLFHTTFARFPDKPTADESEALRTYIHLFQRLYPCGECAEHFGAILKRFPPQVSTRSTAAAWGCHVHNEVNKSLKKELWDCSNIGDFYDCGCAETEGEKVKSLEGKKEVKASVLEVEKDGWTKGG